MDWKAQRRYYDLKSEDEEYEEEAAYDEYIDYLIDCEKEDRIYAAAVADGGENK